MLRGGLFFICLTLNTMILGLLGLPLLWHRPSVRLVARCWMKSNLTCVHFIGGIRLKIHGQENIPSGKAMIIAKHQSTYETLLLCYYLPNAIFILKKELFMIPIFGWYLKQYGMIGIDRAGGVQALRKMRHDANQHFARNKQILIFPEGTRTKPTESCDFQTGFVAMLHDDTPIAPVALCSGLNWPARSFTLYSGEIHIHFLPTINVLPQNKKDIVPLLQQQINDESAKLLALSEIAQS